MVEEFKTFKKTNAHTLKELDISLAQHEDTDNTWTLLFDFACSVTLVLKLIGPQANTTGIVIGCANLVLPKTDHISHNNNGTASPKVNRYRFFSPH